MLADADTVDKDLCLVIHRITIGKVSKTDVALCYDALSESGRSLEINGDAKKRKNIR